MHDFFKQAPAEAIWNILAVCALLGLAFQFGRTLLYGRTPLIEQIARVRRSDLPEALCRYTRRLTLLWFMYLVIAAFFLLLVEVAQPIKAAIIGLTTVIFFVSEHRLRRHLFPEEIFPSLFQQVYDTTACFKRRKN